VCGSDSEGVAVALAVVWVPRVAGVIGFGRWDGGRVLIAWYVNFSAMYGDIDPSTDVWCNN